MCNRGYSFFIVIMLASCWITPRPVTPLDADVPTACEAACKNLKRLDCPGWKGTPGIDEKFGTQDDVSCFSACVDIVDSDPTVTLNQVCVANSDSCKKVDECFSEN